MRIFRDADLSREWARPSRRLVSSAGPAPRREPSPRRPSYSRISCCSTGSPTLCAVGFACLSRETGSRRSPRATGRCRTARGSIDCGGRTSCRALSTRTGIRSSPRSRFQPCFRPMLGYIFLAASAEAERTLMRGFTTVRDLGGPSFALKQAIDEGLARGPRIYPCGAMITTTGGHGDLRPLSDLPRSPGGALSDDGADRRLQYRRQRRRSAPACARTTPSGRLADQARRRRRRVVAPHHARHVDVQRARDARGRRGRRRPEHLCRRARLPAGGHPAGARGRGRSASSTAISWTRPPPG